LSIDDQVYPSILLISLATHELINTLKSQVDDTRIALDKKILSDRYFLQKRKSEQTRQIMMRDDTSVYDSNFDCALTITGSKNINNMDELATLTRRVR